MSLRPVANKAPATKKAQKNASAVALGKLRAASRTSEEQAAYAKLPRKPEAARCACGAMTLKRAQARAHKCGTE